MKTRRDFIKSVGVLGLTGVGSLALPGRGAEPAAAATLEVNDRSYWVGVMRRLATPVLANLSQRTLKQKMPVEAGNPKDRLQYTHLEAFGRLICGLAPWLAADGLAAAEETERQKFVSLAQASLEAATDPHSPDFMNFTRGGQPMVDAAFLAQGILRAPKALWEPLDARLQAQVIRALASTRAISTPHGNNWVLFAATIEAALHTMGEPTVKERLEDCVKLMLNWYKGDGVYGDGEYFHFDYYNSFVIHPMLLDVLAVLKQRDNSYAPVHGRALRRAQRYASIQERLIAPDGSFPSIGRSTTYRFGAFHSLAQIAWLKQLAPPTKPAQVRSALTAVIRKMVEAPGTFDEGGWLRIGFYGHQPSLGEEYISTGSLYLCSAALLPLGLPPADEFWSAPPLPWTSRQLWAGENLHADHAISES